MEKIKKFLARNVWIILILLVATLLLLPQLKVPWMLIDDGESLRVAQEAEDQIRAGNPIWFLQFEKIHGRFRPVYWLYHLVTFKLFGFNAVFHHFAHLLVYLGITLMVYKLIKAISGSDLAGFLGGIFLLLFSPAKENLYRLGTAEPNFTLYLLLMLYFLVKKRFLPTLIFLTLIYFNKETSIILIPYTLGLLVLTSFWNQKAKETKVWRKFFLKFLVANLILAAVQRLIVLKLGIGGGYSQYYVFSLIQMIRGGLGYWKMILGTYNIFLALAGIAFVLKLISHFPWIKKLDSVMFWEIALLGWFLLFLTIQTPWIFVMGRYLPPILVGLVPLIAIENAKIVSFSTKILSSRRVLGKILFVLMGLLLARFVIVNGREVMAMYQAIVPGETRNAKAVEFLAKNTVSFISCQFLFQLANLLSLLFNNRVKSRFLLVE